MSQSTSSPAALQEMLEINLEQRGFYEGETLTLESQGNLATKLWRKMRRRQQAFRRALGVDELIYGLHETWMGDLSEKSVLDLGCYSGNVLSLSIAERSKAYRGVDLSRPAITELNRKLAARGLDHARAEAVDFLSPEFGDEQYDLIYAFSVMHHFKHFDVFLDKLAAHLRPGGRVIACDPLQTSAPVRAVRRLYRPFQSDSDWEWPFDRETFDRIERVFRIVELQGVMGRAKWGLPLLPLSERAAAAAGRKWFAYDRTRAVRPGPALWGCLQVTMCLEARADPPAAPPT